MKDFQSRINDLNSRRMIPFTRHPKFNSYLDALVIDMKSWVEQDQKAYAGDWAWPGIRGLIFNVVRKGSRLWDLFMDGKAGKDKLDDEFKDNLMVAVYSILYYRMLERKEDEYKE